MDHTKSYHALARYLENQIRETFGLTGTPIRMITREHGDGSAKAGKV